MAAAGVIRRGPEDLEGFFASTTAPDRPFFLTHQPQLGLIQLVRRGLNWSNHIISWQVALYLHLHRFLCSLTGSASIKAFALMNM